MSSTTHHHSDDSNNQLTREDRVRVAMLAKCAAAGLPIRDVAAFVKTAIAAPVATGVGMSLGQGLTGIGSTAKDVLSRYMSSPIAILAYGLPLAAGAGGVAGHTLGKLNSTDVDPKAVKEQELIAAYKAHTARLRQLAASRR